MTEFQFGYKKGPCPDCREEVVLVSPETLAQLGALAGQELPATDRLALETRDGVPYTVIENGTFTCPFCGHVGMLMPAGTDLN